MRPTVLFLVVALLAASGMFDGAKPAPERWADAKLPVRDGLALGPGASRASGAKPPPADGKLAGWRDASGHGRTLRAPTPEARPKLVRAGETAVVRFNGVDAHLRAVKQSARLDSFTV